MRIQPFAALRPRPDLAERVASVPYDVVTTEEAAALADGLPESFLHVIRPEIDLPGGTDLYSDEVYATAKANLDRFVAEGWLQRDAGPSLYLYRQQMGDHVQTGLVATCHADDYAANIIKKHEYTLKKKEDDRTRHTSTLMANAGPVFLTYRDDASIDALVAKDTAGEPDVDFTAPDGVRHTVWVAADPDAYVAGFTGVANAYVADGHHRSASAVRVAKECAEANTGHTGDELYNWYLCVLFPESQLNVLAYNRLVSDLGGLTEEELLAKAAERFTVTPDAAPMPEGKGHIRMVVGGKWYGLTWDDVPSDPVEQLDVAILQDRLLGPVLGIDDPKTNPRISFVGGIHGPDRLERDVVSGKAAVGFSLYPVAVGEVMDVADADKVMPPKSTWFEPKLRSGLLVNTLEG